jgi:hypothetical protein
MSHPVPPIVRFHTLIDGAQPPRRADRSAAGTLPMRAVRYCEAVTSAAAFGWWIFPPLDLTLLWDGTDVYWRHRGVSEWLLLQPAAQFPDFAAQFDCRAPQPVRGYSPPLLTALPEPGVVQLWTGVIARTAPGWNLLVRAPANLPAPGGYCLYEGIVDTDRWFGPMFTNLRLTRTDRPVRLRADFPLLQVQPIQQAARTDAILSSAEIEPGLDGLQLHDWDDYLATIVLPNQNAGRDFGAYGADARKRARNMCSSAAQGHQHPMSC